ncbi:hypothetical protein ASPWEDRAFT_26623 [Aspergillus wentii DTO 134E9]|uniref:Glycosyltransferase 2 n=1 Tax=Aspergillus wentii DTO 134E9 TaxID=1073089 RepID=A0A1L9RQY0_ASPWE|nr:uncharacterized protein ASPWEDRAFT_26623 [Aspergillus wentii DTO 134E9]KAI9928297.1 hypothetical protein MW887_002330 [Aspergillus wentii]OJJ37217.1 hypothetical protein ASPWEDRAFT_26623 [Aspergillus wentii DTO 134E9]
MLPPRKPYLADEELGKKDDDHRPQSDRERLWQSKQWKTPRRRRILMTIVGLYLIYLFFHNMPTDLVPAAERYNPAIAQARQKGRTPTQSPVVPQQGPPPRDKDTKGGDTEGLYYDGPITFYALGKTLQRFKQPPNRHGTFANNAVVFAGSSLRSVSDLLPLACDMAGRKLNHIHFVLMGRDDVSVEGIQQVNGISDADCPINWHDARPDYAQWSIEARMEKSVMAGLGYVHSYIRPQVIITQGESWEDTFFWKGIQTKIQDIRTSHIALPSAARDLMWIAALDSSALQVWNDVHVEILIHAPSESSGSLIRLIKSLEKADYLGSTPSLTIELPLRVDPQLLNFLQSIQWPPQLSSKVTIRRRIQPHDMNSIESSIKTVEAFYPRDPSVSHLLVLSPQTELAPSFYHYLKYSLLNYKHSVRAKRFSSKLIGISLELPSSKPITNGEPFSPPVYPSSGSSQHIDGEPLPLFLWQAPSSNAALYFGDKWVELHSFLSNRLAIQEATGNSPSGKIISKKYPAVMEYILELIRARGYYMLYPSFPAKGTYSLATIHNDLYQAPEEFTHGHTPETTEMPDERIDDPSQPLTAESIEGLGSVEKPLGRASTTMALLDRFSLSLPEVDDLPLLSYRGDLMSGSMYDQDTKEYARKFRVLYGGCADEVSKDEASSDSLFCPLEG